MSFEAPGRANQEQVDEIHRAHDQENNTPPCITQRVGRMART